MSRSVEVKIKPNVIGKTKKRLTSNIVALIYFYPHGMFYACKFYINIHFMYILNQDEKIH